LLDVLTAEPCDCADRRRGEERRRECAAGVEIEKESKVIPIGRNMVLCWLKLTETTER